VEEGPIFVFHHTQERKMAVVPVASLFLTAVDAAKAISGLINNLRSSGDTKTVDEMKQLPVGTPFSVYAQKALAAMATKFADQWTTLYPNVPYEHDRDEGAMQPYDSKTAGTTPQCIVDQVKLDLEQWNLPTNNKLATQIARAVVQQLGFHAGMKAPTHGRLQINANQMIYWLAVFQEYDVTQTTLGALYVFGAALGDIGVEIPI
jgi:hypothetical protein